MNAWMKLAIGAVLTGFGVAFLVDAQEGLSENWQCKDCDDEVTEVAPLEEDIPSFVDEDIPSFVDEAPE
jgi:hypothetical protein